MLRGVENQSDQDVQDNDLAGKSVADPFPYPPPEVQDKVEARGQE